jgi:hypothetical protein
VDIFPLCDQQACSKPACNQRTGRWECSTGCAVGSECCQGTCYSPGTNPCICDANDQVTCCECYKHEGTVLDPEYCWSTYPSIETCFAACEAQPGADTGTRFVWTGRPIFQVPPNHKPVCGANNRCQWIPCGP